MKKKRVYIIKYEYVGYESVPNSYFALDRHNFKEAITEIDGKAIVHPNKTDNSSGKIKVISDKSKSVILNTLRNYPGNDNGDPLSDWTEFK